MNDERLIPLLEQYAMTRDTALRDELFEAYLPLAKAVARKFMGRGVELELSLIHILAPVFAYYFLRDRKRIGEWLLMLVPISKRGLTIKLLREMRRETAGYLRGQLMVSAVVGGLTAVGLLFCGVPAWLLLGLLMGVLELIPYVGPFLGGVIVVLFSLQGGLSRTLWALGVVILVQQLEGGMLSPQLMSDATRLHPVAVLLCVMIGGAAGGMGGILLSVPLLLCMRAALRVIGLYHAQEGKT